MDKIYVNSVNVIDKLKHNFDNDGEVILNILLSYFLRGEKLNLTEYFISYSGDEFIGNKVALSLKNGFKKLQMEVSVILKTHQINSYEITKTGINFYVKNR